MKVLDLDLFFAFVTKEIKNRQSKLISFYGIANDDQSFMKEMYEHADYYGLTCDAFKVYIAYQPKS